MFLRMESKVSKIIDGKGPIWGLLNWQGHCVFLAFRYHQLLSLQSCSANTSWLCMYLCVHTSPHFTTGQESRTVGRASAYAEGSVKTSACFNFFSSCIQGPVIPCHFIHYLKMRICFCDLMKNSAQKPLHTFQLLRVQSQSFQGCLLNIIGDKEPSH